MGDPAGGIAFDRCHHRFLPDQLAKVVGRYFAGRGRGRRSLVLS